MMFTYFEQVIYPMKYIFKTEEICFCLHSLNDDVIYDG